jgi:hypothetical protein
MSAKTEFFDRALPATAISALSSHFATAFPHRDATYLVKHTPAASTPTSATRR